MSLIVQKFGGSSVADVEKLKNVAKIITNAKKEGNDVVVVVSAQGDTTDELIEKAKQINENPSKREMDVLLSVGEQITISLLSMLIEKMGFLVVSLTGWQAGFKTNSEHTNAKIIKIDTTRLKSELEMNKIVIVAGFQGVDRQLNITTLGRGGSDTSAVALAACLHADLCKIYTDVDGVYTADPNLVKNAVKLKEISYDEMLELATLGAQVLHNRSVEMAKRYNVNLEVLSSFKNEKGTIVREDVKMEKLLIRGVTKDDYTARISLINVPNETSYVYHVFSLLGKYGINVDLIVQSYENQNKKDISFTVPLNNMELAVKIINENKERLKIEDLEVSSDVSKVSIVGAGMQVNPGVAAKFFEALYNANIKIHMISTSEIKISVIIDKKDSILAINSIHDAFF